MIFDEKQNRLGSKTIKWLCDLVLYNLLCSDENEFNRISNIYLKDIRGEIQIHYMNQLQGSEINVTRFQEEYCQLELDYIILGEPEVWKNSTLLKTIVEKSIEKRKLWGEMYHDAVDKFIEELSYSLKHSYWDESCYYNVVGLVRNAAESWKNKTVSDSKILESDIKKNGEGEEFSISVVVTRDGYGYDESIEDLYYSKDFYVESMQSMYNGSANLFKDSSNSKSNLKELYYSVVNFISSQEIERSTEVIRRSFGDLIVDTSHIAPHKTKIGYFFGGHRCYIDEDYASVTLGNQSIANSIVDRGKEVLQVLDTLLIKNSEISNTSLYFANIYNQWLDTYVNNPARQQQYKETLSPLLMVSVIQGLLNGYKVREVIGRFGHSMWGFPCIELRQDTWQRFSNYYELMNFYHIHENLNLLSSKRAYEYDRTLGRHGVSVVDIPLKAGKTQTPELKLLEEAKKLTMNMAVRIKSGTNLKFKATSPTIENEVRVYKTFLANLQVRCELATGSILELLTTDIIRLYDVLGILIDLSLLCFSKPPNNYSLVSKVNLENLIQPDSTKVEKKIVDLLKYDGVTLGGIYTVREVAKTLLTKRSSPESFLDYIRSIQDSVFSQLEEFNKSVGLHYSTLEYNVYQCNLHNYMNVKFFLYLNGVKKFLLERVREYAGLNQDNSYEQEGTRLLNCVVGITKFKLVETLILNDKPDKFIVTVFIKGLIESNGGDANNCGTQKLFIRDLWYRNIELYNILREEMLGVLNYTDKVDLGLIASIGSVSKVKTITEIDMPTLSRRFQEYYLSQPEIIDLDYNNQDIRETLILNKMRTDLNIVGYNGVPLRQPTGNRDSSTWVYSILGLKTKYPGVDNEIQLMNKEDYLFVFSQLEEVNIGK